VEKPVSAAVTTHLSLGMVKLALKLTLVYCFNLGRRKSFLQPRLDDLTLEIANSGKLFRHLWLTEIFASVLVALVVVLQWGDGMMTCFWEASWVAILVAGHC
jgi:hypothetical protein